MLFSEIYGIYYNTVREILRMGVKGELTEELLKRTVREMAFGESLFAIPKSLKSGRWQLITADYKTPIKNEPYLPMTSLQKSWLKAIMLDKRIRLFDLDSGAVNELSEVKPLFTPEMVYYFDRYSDGDDFEDEGYISSFKTILSAVKERTPLTLRLRTGNGGEIFANVIPEYLEYSEKDDKFRLITSGCRYRRVIKLSSVLSVSPYHGKGFDSAVKSEIAKTSAVFELFDGRNTLERAMLHFAHFEKTVEKLDERRYKVTLFFDPADESEILIRILSFGPFIKVEEPKSLRNSIIERLKKQKKCEN